MKGVYAFFWKGMKEFFASKEAVFWTFIFPIIFGLLFAGVFGHESSPSSIPVGIVPEKDSNNTLCKVFIDGMQGAKVDGKKLFELHNYSSESGAIFSLKNGRVKALLIFDDNFTENITSGIGQGKIKVILDKRDAQEYQLVSSVLASYISSFEDRVREIKVNITMEYITQYGNMTEENATSVERWMKSFANPLKTQEEIYHGESSTETARMWYLTAAIGVTFVFSGMISAASMISSEIEKGTARRLLTTKTKPWEMLTGDILTVLLIQLISSLLIILSFIVVFRELIIFPPSVILMLVIAALSTTSLGLLFSGITKTQRAAAGMANAIAWPISFITGIFFPSFLLPEWMRSIGDYFPASALLRGIRKVIIYNQGIGDYMPQIIGAITLTLIFLVTGSILFRWRMRTL